MIRIEYQVPDMSGTRYHNKVIFADDHDEASDICDLCDKYEYPIIDVSEYIEEA